MPVQTRLPDEAVDMTVTQLHHLVVRQMEDALCAVFGATALVLVEIFLRIGGDYVETGEQVSPDLLVVPGATGTRRTVYRVPDEPVPSVTVEVLSAANYRGEGRAALEHKRDLLGRIGVPTHIEIDPERGEVTVWENHGDALVVTGPPADHYDGPALGGIEVQLAPGHMSLRGPDGEEYLDFAGERRRADAEAARAERYRELLRRQGIDPDQV